MKETIEYQVVDSPNRELLLAAARLHIAHLSYRSFITLFGIRFIAELYHDILSSNQGFMVFAFEKKNVCGFVLGCLDNKKIFSSVKKKFLKYFRILLPRLIIRPRLIPKIVETLFYVNKENTDVHAELIVIVTDTNYRGLGIGSGLVERLNAEFIKRGVRSYKVTVHDEMKRSNNFYIQNGMKPATSFQMYGVKWNLYIKKLSA